MEPLVNAVALRLNNKLAGLTRPDAFYFSPQLGALEARLFKLARVIAASPNQAAEYVEAAALKATESVLEAGKCSDLRAVAWAYALSVLSDVLAAGGRAWVQDSTIMVSWPDWNSEQGEKGLRAALTKLRTETKIPVADERLSRVFSPALSGSVLKRILFEGSFRLCDASEVHPSGISYQSIFRAAATYWTMPVRDREGRNKRFVLTVTHSLFQGPQAVAILEIGDGAPLSSARDSLLGLTPESFLKWLDSREKREEKLLSLRQRLAHLRSALLPLPGETVGHAKDSLSTLYEKVTRLERLAAGRSTDSENLSERKRFMYLARIVRSSVAVQSCLDGDAPAEKDISALVRLLRDLVIPRAHLELTICGGLPPYSFALAGKLAVAFAGDQRVIDVCRSPIGSILGQVFDREKLAALVPSEGAVLITTKGLFSEHSAQYTRATIPGSRVSMDQHVRKIGLTSGVTASLMSRRTYRLAQAYLEESASTQISDEFGSGGSKRQRRIEAVARAIGLPEGLIHPRLKRPIYAIPLASNIQEVALLNEQPEWVIPKLHPDEYAVRAAHMWRARWGETIDRRLKSTATIAGGADLLLSIRDA